MAARRRAAMAAPAQMSADRKPAVRPRLPGGGEEPAGRDERPGVHALSSGAAGHRRPGARVPLGEQEGKALRRKPTASFLTTWAGSNIQDILGRRRSPSTGDKAIDQSVARGRTRVRMHA
jgi:hypothetical protein